MVEIWRQPVALVNGRVWHRDGVAGTIRFSTRVLAIDTPPLRGDAVIDLDGAWVLPGLINAHDHLELNHFGRLKFRDTYLNATEWIDDMRPRLRADPAIVSGLGRSLADRLLIGALKNVLAGVTTVAHHNPLYPELRWHYPLKVVRRFGWAHSFALEGHPVGARGEPGAVVGDALRRTASDAPFIVHLSEGTDEGARQELDRLEALGGLTAQTVLVHGVGIDDRQWTHVHARGASVVWCPASNVFLFGRTLGRAALHAGANGPAAVCLGTDARITGSRDLLDELRVALGLGVASPDELLGMVTTVAAAALRVPDAGSLAEGRPADLCVVPGSHASPADALVATHRRDMHMVVVGGRPMVSDPRYGPAFDARRTAAHASALDGAVKLLDRQLARRLARCSLGEPGLEVNRV